MLEAGRAGFPTDPMVQFLLELALSSRVRAAPIESIGRAKTSPPFDLSFNASCRSETSAAFRPDAPGSRTSR